MLNQAKEFNEAVKLSGLILTKLDGTARGGGAWVRRLGPPAVVGALGTAQRVHACMGVDGLNCRYIPTLFRARV